MRCLYPRTVGFKEDGKTISWSQKTFSKEYPTFQLPCGKCIECRLEYARQWAVRCVHEAAMHEENSFITLTYADKYLKNEKLVYQDFQLFIGRLRDKIFRETVAKNFGPGYWASLTATEKKEFRKENKQLLNETHIGCFVTGEYGDEKKRPHWHAIIFNWRPSDCIYQYSNERGDRIFSSRTLGPFSPDEVEECPNWNPRPLWKYGKCEIGAVTFESAGYVARYAAKKLIHGKDKAHEFEPISKKSSKQAIGKSWLEKNYKDIFNYGECVLANGQSTPIPRYYKKWLEKNHPDEWENYITKIQPKKEQQAKQKKIHQEKKYWEAFDKRPMNKPNLITDSEIKIKLINERFKRLQSWLKGDI